MNIVSIKENKKKLIRDMYKEKARKNFMSYKERDFKRIDKKILKGMFIRKFREDETSDEDDELYEDGIHEIESDEDEQVDKKDFNINYTTYKIWCEGLKAIALYLLISVLRAHLECNEIILTLNQLVCIKKSQKQELYLVIKKT